MAVPRHTRLAARVPASILEEPWCQHAGCIGDSRFRLGNLGCFSVCAKHLPAAGAILHRGTAEDGKAEVSYHDGLWIDLRSRPEVEDHLGLSK